MLKTKTLKKREKSSKSLSKKKTKEFVLDNMKKIKLRKGVKTSPDNSVEQLANREHIKIALTECLFTNDVEAFKEILRNHFDAVSLLDLSNETGVSRRTLYRLTEPKSNPTLKTLSKVLSKLVA